LDFVGLLVSIRLTIREVLFELIRLPEFPTDVLCRMDTVGLFELIRLPIRDVLYGFTRLTEFLAGAFGRADIIGLLVSLRPAIREFLLELVRLPVSADIRLPVLGVALLLPTELFDGLRLLDTVGGFETTSRLVALLLD
jgi:hypothetical protein